MFMMVLFKLNVYVKIFLKMKKTLLKFFNLICFKLKLYSLVNYKYFFYKGFKGLTKFAKFVLIIRIFHFL